MSAAEGKEATPPPEQSPDGSTNGEIDPELLKDVEEKAKEVSANCKKEMDAKLESLQKSLKDTMRDTNVKMRDVSERYQTHRHSQITSTQTDLLRVNKLLRDVARELGDDWKPVFKKLMSEFDEASVEAEVASIEQQKPFMRAYKSLTTWKDAVGQDFQPFALVEALNSIDRKDLADKAMATLGENELDSLYSMADFGSGIKYSGKDASAGAAAAEGASSTSEGAAKEEDSSADGAAAKARPRAVLADDFTPVQGLLSDTVLLRVARKLEGEWETLGKGLGVPDQELEEIKEKEGPASVQGAFKMLWTWRNSLGVVSKTHVAVLRGALKKLGKTELAASLQETVKIF